MLQDFVGEIAIYQGMNPFHRLIYIMVRRHPKKENGAIEKLEG